MLARFAAAIYLVVALLLAGFLLALSAGVSWRALMFGRGRSGPANDESRAFAVSGAISLVFMSGIVATAAGIVLPRYLAIAHDVIWLVALYNAVGAARYLFSRSRWARTVWFPAFLVLTICAVLVIRSTA